MPSTIEKVSESPTSLRDVTGDAVKTTSFTIAPDDVRWLDTVAADEQISRSAVVRQALRAFKKSRSLAQV